jgi:hypothetical protein
MNHYLVRPILLLIAFLIASFMNGGIDGIVIGSCAVLVLLAIQSPVLIILRWAGLLSFSKQDEDA